MATKYLIALRGEYDHEFSAKKKTHKSIWNDMFNEMNEKFQDLKVDWFQCQSKWNKLFSRYKAVEDNNSKSGERMKTFEFYEDLAKVMGTNPNVRPLTTIAVGAGNQVLMKEQEQGKQDIQHKKEVDVAKPKKRKTTPSKQDELLSILRELREDRRFEEEQKAMFAAKMKLFETPLERS